MHKSLFKGAGTCPQRKRRASGEFRRKIPEITEVIAEKPGKSVCIWEMEEGGAPFAGCGSLSQGVKNILYKIEKNARSLWTKIHFRVTIQMYRKSGGIID